MIWSAPSSDGGSAITRYEYRYKRSSASSYGSVVSVGTNRFVRKSPSRTNSLFNVQVRAVNAIGNGAWVSALARTDGSGTRIRFDQSSAKVGDTVSVTLIRGTGSSGSITSIDYFWYTKLPSASAWGSLLKSSSSTNFKIPSSSQGHNIRVYCKFEDGRGFFFVVGYISSFTVAAASTSYDYQATMVAGQRRQSILTYKGYTSTIGSLRVTKSNPNITLLSCYTIQAGSVSLIIVLAEGHSMSKIKIGSTTMSASSFTRTTGVGAGRNVSYTRTGVSFNVIKTGNNIIQIWR